MSRSVRRNRSSRYIAVGSMRSGPSSTETACSSNGRDGSWNSRSISVGAEPENAYEATDVWCWSTLRRIPSAPSTRSRSWNSSNATRLRAPVRSWSFAGRSRSRRSTLSTSTRGFDCSVAVKPPAPSDRPTCHARKSESTVRLSVPFSSRSYARSMRTTTLESDRTPSRSTRAVAQPSGRRVREHAAKQARLSVASGRDQPRRVTSCRQCEQPQRPCPRDRSSPRRAARRRCERDSPRSSASLESARAMSSCLHQVVE